ncbi:MAG: efflux RND transporter periplasmic adaptor subunit [Deltaproteobacteria bacterium]
MKRVTVAVGFLFIGVLAGALFVYLFAGRGGVKPVSEVSSEKARKVVYYRNPMDGSVTSPVPMKDPMGMDYAPVYEDEVAAAVVAPGTIRISPERIQKIGVKSEEAKQRDMTRVIRTVGRVEPKEDKVYVINSKVGGWVEKLHVGRTDQMVRPGEPLFDLYSPELVSAQEEFILALNSYEKVKDSPYEDVLKGAAALLDSSRKRLRYWDISEEQIKRLEDKRVASKTMTIRAPSEGSVTEKMIVEGQKIEPGETLYKIIDHSVVWVYGEIYEYEIPYIKVGQKASLYPAYGSPERYIGTVEHIYSHLGSIRYSSEEASEVRTAKVRFTLDNSSHALKLGMYLNVEFSVEAAKNALSVPDSAVIDTGERQIVIVDRRDGTFEPREVKIGARADGFYEILKGVKEGEFVVTSANFLIDSESNLNAAIGATGNQRGNGENEADGKTIPPVKAEKKTPGHEGH